MYKISTVDKMNRKENMIRLKRQGYSYEAIGALYGLSRQRAHQLISGYQKNNKGLRHKNGWYRQIRNSVVKRDYGKCQKCGATKDLIVHHIDGDDANNKFTNLITLCNNCHLDLHRPKGTRNPSKQLLEAQGRGLKGFCVGLLVKLAKSLKERRWE